MTSRSTSCPFCNAIVPLPAPIPARISCPRCSESFVPRSETASTPNSTSGPSLAAELQRHREARTDAAGGSKRSFFFAVGLFLLLGISAFLWYRQRPETRPSPLPPAEKSAIARPQDIPGLFYLPTGTDSLLALQLRPFVNAATENEPTLEEIQATFTQLGVPTQMLGSVEKSIGLSWNQFDQVVIGGTFKKGLMLDTLVFVLHLRAPLAIEDFAKKVRAELITDKKTGRTVYRTTGTPEIHWWLAKPQVLIGAFSREQLQRVPETPADSLDHLDPAVVEAARTLLLEDHYCWGMIQCEKFGTMLSLLALTRKELAEWQDPVDQIRSIAVGLRPTATGPEATAWLELKSETTAQGWRSALQSRFAGQAQIRVSGSGNQVTVTLPADEKSIRMAVGKK